jgi:hypothetical protein
VKATSFLEFDASITQADQLHQSAGESNEFKLLFAAFSFRDCRTRVFVRNSDMASPKKTATKAASAPKKAAAKTKGERKPNAYQEFMKAESAKIRANLEVGLLCAWFRRVVS